MRLGRSARLALEILGALVAVAMVALLVAFWRVTTAPVSVDFLTPHLERAFAAEGVEVRVGRTLVIWDGARRDIELEARDWRIRDAQGQPLAYLPRVRLSLSLQALLQGTVAATRVELDRARLRILRHPDGRFAFAGPAGDAEEVPDLSLLADAVLADLLQSPDPSRPISYLQRIDIRNARLLLDDRRIERRLEVREASLQLWREVGGLGGHLVGRAALGEADASIVSSLWYSADRQLLQAGLQFEGLSLVELGAWTGLAELAGVDLAFDGSLDADIPVDGRLPSGRFTLEARQGRVELPQVFSLPFAIEALDLEGSFDGPGQQLDLRRLSLQLGSEQEPGPLLSAQAEAARSEGGTELHLEALVADVSIEDLRNYWPIALRDGGRPWVVANILEGGADQGSVRARVTLPDDPAAEPLVQELSGDFRFHGLEVHYLRPLPPATGVAGHASFDAHSFDFVVETGQMQDLSLSGGKVTISGLQEPMQYLDIGFGAQGPLPTVLRLLEHPRLRLLDELGFSSQGSEGRARAEVRFRLPLQKELTFEQVEVGVEAGLESVLLRDAVLGQDLSGGPLQLSLDQSGMQVSGELALGGVPAQEVVWQESFTGAGERTRVRAFVPRLDDAGRERLGFGAAPYLTGPLSARIDLASGRGGDGRVDLALDLGQAELRLEELSWIKPAGSPAELSARLQLRGEQLAAVEALQLAGGGLTLQGGRVDFVEGAPRRFHFEQAALEGTRLQQLVLGLPLGGGVEVDIGAGNLDLQPFLKRDEAAGAEGAGEGEPPPLRIVAPSLSELNFGDGRYLQSVELRLHRTAAGWQELVLRGAVPPELWRLRGDPAADGETQRKEVKLTYGRAAERPGYGLNLHADDMGAALRALDLFDTLEGGELSVVGRSDGPLPAAAMRFELWAEDYTLVGAPAMARLLTIASLSGLGNLLAGEGIAFQRLVGEVELADGRLTTDLVRAYGPSLGITARGHLDLEGEDSLLRGTLVPAYSINQVLGAIPLLGFLLTGREGEGVLGVTYRLTGSIEDPQFSVNPLSVLAPGFLRGLFDLPAGEGGGAPSAFPDDFDDTRIGN